MKLIVYTDKRILEAFVKSYFIKLIIYTCSWILQVVKANIQLKLSRKMEEDQG